MADVTFDAADPIALAGFAGRNSGWGSPEGGLIPADRLELERDLALAGLRPVGPPGRRPLRSARDSRWNVDRLDVFPRRCRWRRRLHVRRRLRQDPRRGRRGPVRPRRLPAVHLALPPADPPWRDLDREGKVAGLLTSPRRGAAQVGDLPDFAPGQQPVAGATGFQGVGRANDRCHGAAIASRSASLAALTGSRPVEASTSPLQRRPTRTPLVDAPRVFKLQLPLHGSSVIGRCSLTLDRQPVRG